jgi:uncharacterized protein
MLKIENKLFVSWSDVRTTINILCKKIITELPNVDSVIGLERGGLIPAVMVSHELNLPYSKVILPNTLVIDDICDSGVTLKNTVGVYTAALYHKPHTSCFTPNLYSKLHKGNEWLIFPWERNDSEEMQDYLNK